MAKKHCERCEDGTMPVAIVFADDGDCEVTYANYCPECGRRLDD